MREPRTYVEMGQILAQMYQGMRSEGLTEKQAINLISAVCAPKTKSRNDVYDTIKEILSKCGE